MLREQRKGPARPPFLQPTTYNLRPTTYHLQPHSGRRLSRARPRRRPHPPPQPGDVALAAMSPGTCWQRTPRAKNVVPVDIPISSTSRKSRMLPPPSSSSERIAKITVGDVMNDRPIVCSRLWFTASGKLRIWPRNVLADPARTPRSSHVPRSRPPSSNPVMKNVFTSTSKHLAEDRERAHDQQHVVQQRRSPTRRIEASSARCGTRG